LKVLPVILCGGSGTRLWPLSRQQFPKQMLNLGGEHTMLQATALRIKAAALPEDWHLEFPLVVGQEECRFLTAEQLHQIGLTQARILLEPVGRNTAPALTLAALTATASGEDPILVVMPADHVMSQPDKFREALHKAIPLATAGRMVTFGIKPALPETGYGYIQCGAQIADSGATEIAQFVEKPDAETAQRYLAAGNYLWNSGIYIMRASTWLTQIARFRADILEACRVAMEMSTRDTDFIRVGTAAFAGCPSDSIDYAVMERITGDSTLSAVLPLDAGWSDVGAWNALWEIGEKDAAGNVLEGDVFTLDSENMLVRAENRMVACIGMKDTVVVETPDVVLVANRDQLHLVKSAVAKLKLAGRSECDQHRKVHRPWGYYDSIDTGHRFQVKRIVVSPGACLSLQMHHHRAEHWVVVMGTAKVTRGDEQFLLSENQSAYIPLGTVHRLENPGVVPLEIIEVQSGAYLGEDDIVRFQDNYHRDDELLEQVIGGREMPVPHDMPLHMDKGVLMAKENALHALSNIPS
jgi:mannose-1-phosphate guanylyltransferase/mannose-6-phosphate isomerase